jgi:hypothetical protein
LQWLLVRLLRLLVRLLRLRVRLLLGLLFFFFFSM